MLKHIRPSGKLFFSAFIDDDLEGFDDRAKGKPLRNAFYGRRYMENIVEDAGWAIELFHDKDQSCFIQHYLLCSPVK